MRVGLTGGIAAGKSVAADELRRCGLVVIDYDELARDVVGLGTPGLAAVGREFGPDIMAGDGQLDRARLGQVVFASPVARRRLEAIVHPLVQVAAAEAEAAARRRGRRVVVHEIPLLVDDLDPSLFDQVVTVEAPVALRTRRLVEDRGLTPAEAAARIGAQVDDTARRGVADVCWSGSGSPEQLRAQVRAWVESLGGTMSGNRPMHKAGREIKDFDQIIDVLRRCPTGHVGLVDDDGPYVVPINYGFEVVAGRVVLWMHGATVGRKIDAINADPRVCFEADIQHDIVTDVPFNDLTTTFESVIGFGRASIVTDPVEASRGAAIMVEANAPGRGVETMAVLPPSVAIIKIELDQITGKRHLAPHD